MKRILELYMPWATAISSIDIIVWECRVKSQSGVDDSLKSTAKWR